MREVNGESHSEFFVFRAVKSWQRDASTETLCCDGCDQPLRPVYKPETIKGQTVRLYCDICGRVTSDVPDHVILWHKDHIYGKKDP